MILCPKRNRATAQRGELEERDTCCEARDYTLVSHNSPVSQIPPGPHSHSLNARRRKRDMKGTACPGDDDRNMVFLLTQWCQQQAERGVGDGTNSGVTSKRRRNLAFLDLCYSASVWAHIPMCVKKKKVQRVEARTCVAVVIEMKGLTGCHLFTAAPDCGPCYA